MAWPIPILRRQQIRSVIHQRGRPDHRLCSNGQNISWLPSRGHLSWVDLLAVNSPSNQHQPQRIASQRPQDGIGLSAATIWTPQPLHRCQQGILFQSKGGGCHQQNGQNCGNGLGSFPTGHQLRTQHLLQILHHRNSLWSPLRLQTQDPNFKSGGCRGTRHVCHWARQSSKKLSNGPKNRWIWLIKTWFQPQISNFSKKLCFWRPPMAIPTSRDQSGLYKPFPTKFASSSATAKRGSSWISNHCTL